jgi:LuxR family maltose regulon positive regulatory protein
VETPVHPPWADLTGREREILSLLAEGLSNKRIALQLELSPYTVKRHVANVLGKLDVASRGQAAAAWYRAHVPRGITPARAT